MLRHVRGRWRSGRPAPRPKTVLNRHQLLVEQLEDRLAPSVADFRALAADPAAYDPMHVLVRLRPEVFDPAGLLSFAGVQFASPLPLVPGLWEVRLADGVSVPQALAAFRSSPFVDYASPNYTLHLTRTPNDPRFGEQWGWHNTGQSTGTPDADVDAPEAWDVATGSSNTVVAVIDTGVDYNHPDLVGNIWTNPGEVSGDGIDNDGNGFVDDIHGYDFANNDGNPLDDHSHGTHVAGTIGAVGNNGLGVTGAAWNVRIMAVKFLNASGSGTTANAIRALNYAVLMGAHVSNNSYGGSSASDADPLFLQAIRNAAAFGHIFVAGAGNSGLDNDATAFYPASFDADNIISVAATDRNDQLAGFSNFGAASVDIAAPGVDILSTLPNGAYGLNSGTSMASPHVAGVVALVRSLHPDWTYRQVIDQVLGAVDFLPWLDGRVASGGRLNAARALRDTDGPRVVATNPTGGVGGVIGSMRVWFNEPIEPATLGIGDFSFTGPGGSIPVTGVAAVPGSLNRQFVITFAPQAARGTYTMLIGPAITDRSGNAMDQDADGTLGEAIDDRHAASFTIGDRNVFRSADTPKSFPPFAVTSSAVVVDQDLSIADLDVQVNITSADVGFIGATLISPAGTRIDLAPLRVAQIGPQYRDTVFDDEAATPIANGASPFAGSYRPAAPLSAVDNQIARGTWRLEMIGLFGGTINSWSLLVVANPPRLTVDDVAVAEGVAGTTQANFTVRLSNVTGQPVTVQYATANGTAVAGVDYTATSGTLTFEPGELTKTVTVAVSGDALDELDETFVLNLSNAGNGTIADGQAVATIRNDEVAVSINDISVAEGNIGTVGAVFTITLSTASTHAVTVQYATAPGSATAGADYTTANGAVVFAPGETAKTVSVTVRGDTQYERTETYFVNLVAIDAITSDGQAVGTILNDDAIPAMSVNDVSVSEGDSGTRVLNFIVSLTGASDVAITVNFATSNGTAAAGSDYTAAAGTLTFPPGQSSRTVAVTVSGDTTIEPTESLFLDLSSPGNTVLVDGRGVGTILNDDVSLTIDDITVAEGDSGTSAAVFTVRLSAPAPFAVQLDYSTSGSTAAAGSDFVATSGTLTFAPGETFKSIAVTGIGDFRDEVDEVFFVNLSGAVNAAVADGQGRATIADDDPLPALSIADVAVTEGTGGAKSLTFTVTLSAPSGQTVTVDYATGGGTATAGSDYQAGTGRLTFFAGATSQSVIVPLTTDGDGEIDETFGLALSGAVNATILDGQAFGTILDDDSLVVDDVTVVEGDAGTVVAFFAVRLLAPRVQAVTVDFATANGTASAGADYLPTAGSLTFLPGETVKTVGVTVFGDRLNEANETVILRILNAVGAGVGDSQAQAAVTNDDPVPGLSVSDLSVVEGHTGTKNLTFTLTLSEASGQTVTVQYATADGTATAGEDYQPRSGSVSFSPGANSRIVTVPVNSDLLAEGNEAFVLTLFGAANAVLIDGEASAVIYDDDPLPSLSINDQTTTEGNAGTKTVYFTVTLSMASTQTVAVQFTTSDGTAVAGSDYTGKTELVTFAPGQLSRTVGVTITGDASTEPTETFFTLLSAPTNAVLGDIQGVGTIQNDDSALQVDDVTVSEGDDGVTSVVFTVSLTGPLSADPVTVAYATGGGTATADSDYVATNGTLVFAPGETTRTVTILVVGDTLNENAETLLLNLSGAVNAAIADSQGTATIVDAADPTPVLSIDDAAVVEGATGTKVLNFTVRLSAPSGKSVTVNYATANSTAQAGSDYLARTGTLTFSPGTLTQTVSVTIIGDTSAETDDTFVVNLSGAVNATLGDAQAVGTIQDDDSLVVDDLIVAEGDDGTVVASITVRLLVPRDQAVSVSYATANGTAAAGGDYLGAAGTLTFAPGETAKTVQVVIVGDRADEPDETFFLNLSGATGALIADAQGRATVVDDDATPSLSVGGGTAVAEGDVGARTATFTVTLSQPSGQNVTVVYATQDGTASAASGDYQPKTGTLTFYPGQTTQTVTVTINGDTAVEGDETLFLVLSSPANATIAAGQAVVTIVDDDGFGTIGTLDMISPPGGSALRARAERMLERKQRHDPWFAIEPPRVVNLTRRLDWFGFAAS